MTDCVVVEGNLDCYFKDTRIYEEWMKGGKKMDAIIFDIDGTLANLSHRLHHIKDGRQDWDSFFNEVSKDEPIEDVVWLAEALAYAQSLEDFEEYFPFSIFFCSGRPERCREDTESWLYKNCEELFAYPNTLLMRPDGDHRPDTEIKREMLRNIRGQGYNVRAVFDDRQRVVDMWRQEGVRCYQVCDTPWDRGERKYAPGKLILLVGPSGAGKSTFAYDNYPASMIVSTDETRTVLCGDWREQSKNEQVFSAVRAIVKARIESGLDTVVDATNISAKERKSYLDIVPSDCKVDYVVIDRPLDEKHSSSGWRDNVVIPKTGQKLVDYHHMRFQSSLKNILAGDGDPRVRVIDMREC